MALRTSDSPHSVRGTRERLVAALARREINLFAVIDHGAGARDAGLELADEEVVIFGDPKVGTLLMQADPNIGFELPLRILITDRGGQTVLGFRAPTELATEYDVGEHIAILERMTSLLEQLLAESISG